jgi:hypothetical protein
VLTVISDQLTAGAAAGKAIGVRRVPHAVVDREISSYDIGTVNYFDCDNVKSAAKP